MIFAVHQRNPGKAQQKQLKHRINSFAHIAAQQSIRTRRLIKYLLLIGHKPDLDVDLRFQAGDSARIFTTSELFKRRRRAPMSERRRDGRKANRALVLAIFAELLVVGLGFSKTGRLPRGMRLRFLLWARQDIHERAGARGGHPCLRHASAQRSAGERREDA